MRIVKDNLFLCADCTAVSCNGTGGLDIPEKTLAETVRGLEHLGPHLVPDFNSETGDGLLEFSRRACDSCETVLAGYRARFAILGEELQRSI
jgi:hypothetical protein